MTLHAATPFTKLLCTGRVFLQSDVEEAAASMHDEFREHASSEFKYDFRERPISEAELLQSISQTAAPGVSDGVGEHAADGLFLDGMNSTLDSTLNGASAVQQQKIQWMPENPIGVPTEREIHSTQDGGQAFRILFVRR